MDIVMICLVVLDAQSLSERGVHGLALQYSGIVGHAMSEPDVTSNHGIVANSNSSEDGGIGIYRDMVSDNRVTGNIDGSAVFIVYEVFGAQCHSLI